MRRPIDTKAWCYGDLTGGGSFCTSHQSGDIFVATPVRADGSIGLLRSQDKGDTWKEVWSYALYTGSVPPSVTSEPQTAYDPLFDTLYAVYHKDLPGGGSTLIMTSWDLKSLYYHEPIEVIKAQKFKPSYCVIWDSGASEIVVVAIAIDPEIPSAMTGKWGIVEAVYNSNFATIRSNIIMDYPLTHRTSYGALQGLYSQGQVEIYCNERPRVYGFKEKTCSLWSLTRPSKSSSWTAAKIYDYDAEFNDDRMIVMQHGPNRYLSYVFYVKTMEIENNALVARLHYKILLGYKGPLGWTFNQINTGQEATDPTFSITSSGIGDPVLTLAYLCRGAQSDGDGSLVISSWNPQTGLVTPLPDPKLKVAYLRGGLTQHQIPGAWDFIAVNPQKNEAWYLSYLNLPPTPVLAPSTGVIKRGAPFTLNGVGTSDPDMDLLTFTWEIDRAHTTFPDQVTLIPHGSQAELVVKKTWGPDSGKVRVKMTVHDMVGGVPLHEVFTTGEYSVEYNSQPYINWPDNPVIVPRMSGVTLVPIIEDKEKDNLVYTWEQIAGPKCKTSDPKAPRLDVDLSQSRVLGEDYQFRLTVEDGINLPVESVITVKVPPIKLAPSVLDGNLIYRALWQIDTGEDEQ